MCSLCLVLLEAPMPFLVRRMNADTNTDTTKHDIVNYNQHHRKRYLVQQHGHQYLILQQKFLCLYLTIVRKRVTKWTNVMDKQNDLGILVDMTRIRIRYSIDCFYCALCSVTRNMMLLQQLVFHVNNVNHTRLYGHGHGDTTRHDRDTTA